MTATGFTNESTSIGATLAAFMRHSPQIAITHADSAWTYEQLIDRIFQMARALRAEGLGRGDVVAIATGNRPETYVLRYAANVLGCCSSVLYDDLAPSLLTEMLRTVGAKALVFDPDSGADQALAAIQELPGTAALALGKYPDVVNVQALADAQSAEPVAVEALPEDTSAIRLTGGSTGTPKGIPQDFRVPFYLTAPALKMWEGATQLMCTAIGHLAGTLSEAVLAAGGRVVVQDWFNPDEVLRAIERERVTFIWLQPAMLHQLLDHPALESTDTSSLRSLMISGGPSTPHRITQAIQRFGPIITQGYGAYEIGQITILSPTDHQRPELLTTVGRPVPGTQVSIRDDEGQSMDNGVTGEIWVRGPSLMTGYHNQPDQTAKALTDGWFRTGDLGTLDSEGYLTLAGRRKDVIIGARETIYPSHIESVLHRHPGIQQAVVFGATGSDNDEQVCAAVVPTPSHQLSEGDVTEWISAELGGAYAPEAVLVLEEMPTMGSNKPDRTVLRALIRDRLKK
ncbi:AMP-binding protein [Nocardia sp. NBC_01499]|uniref:AMP-binding protein n=1 Tax=Nocardia sp. NBC_01499 TaxID=2903597 RepID=UPI003863777D